MLDESQRIKKELETIKNTLSKFPSNHFICTEHNGYFKWYQSDGHTKTYIPKSNRKLAEQLATKKYLTLLSQDLTQEKTAIDFYLRHHKNNPGQAEELLKNEEYHRLLSPYFKPLSQSLFEWANAPYEKNQQYPDALIHKCISGNMVRSKSEVLIDTLLYTHKIPFRYECALTLGNDTIYPDFTICHPQTGKIFYWEHFGLIDQPNYRKKMIYKINLFTAHQIYPSIQLITTYETEEHPLSTQTVEKMIEQYFL